MTEPAGKVMETPAVQMALQALLASIQAAAKDQGCQCLNLTVGWVIAPAKPGPVEASSSSIVWGDDDEEIINLVIETIGDPVGTRPAPAPMNQRRN